MVEYGKYRAGSELATGAFTSVYGAQKPGSKRAYAVKVLTPAPELWSPKESERQISAFLARAEVQQKAARIGKRYWAPVHDMGRQGTGAYYVTHHYPLSVETLIDRHLALDSARLYRLTLRIVRGLQALDKACGQAHGNLHPHNVLLERKRHGYSVHLADPAVGVGVGGRAGDLQALGALIQGLILHKPVDPNRDWTLERLESFLPLRSRAIAWREFCGKLLGVGTQLAFTDLTEVDEALKALRPRSAIAKYGGIILIPILGAVAILSIMYPGHVRRWKAQLLHRDLPALTDATTQSANPMVATHPATQGAIVPPSTVPNAADEAARQLAVHQAAEQRKLEDAQREQAAHEQARLQEIVKQRKAAEAAAHMESERKAEASALQLWKEQFIPPSGLKNPLLKLAWISCRDQWLAPLTQRDDHVKKTLDALAETLQDWERDIPEAAAIAGLPDAARSASDAQRQEIFQSLTKSLDRIPVGIPDALSPLARAAAKNTFAQRIKEHLDAANLIDAALKVNQAPSPNASKERETLGAMEAWLHVAPADAPERAQLQGLHDQVQALPQARAKRVAAMVKDASRFDDPEHGHQALPILDQALSLDPGNKEAAGLKLKITSYYNPPASLDDCIQAAKAGSVPAIKDLIERYLKGRGTAKNPAAAIPWLEPLANKGDLTAINTLAEIYAKGQGVPPDPVKAMHWYDQAAAQGDAVAMLGVGRMHAHADPPEYAQAIKWFRQAAEKGNPDAMSELASCYDNGRGTPRNAKEAASWYKKAADAGSVDAQFHLGKLAFEAHDRAALKLLSAAAEAGNADAMHYLGSMYNVGLGVDQDYAQCMDWYTKAANAGSVEAMADLGQMYYEGTGVKPNPAAALPWFQKAADAGSANAMFTLGVMYQQGKGVTADPVTAFQWYTKSAKAGNSLAMRRVAQFYNDGKTVPKDTALADEWNHKADLAAAKGQ